ncbi:MAG TPA: YceI family protein [bacterium]|nr:YceI family protein [bacterium]
MKGIPAFLALAILLPALAAPAEPKVLWKLEKSQVSYVVTHPLHVVHGKTASARGKGVSYGGHGEFLVAVPVKSFDSGDENRDLHMLEVTRAGDHPLIEVRIRLKKLDISLHPNVLLADLSVKFAGRTVEYPGVRLETKEWTSQSVRVIGRLSLSLKAYGIKPPSLLTMPVEDEVPVQIDMVWAKSVAQ